MADAAMPSTGDTTSGHRFVSGHRFASMAGAVLLSAMALAACGESAQDKAKAEICTARDEISKQVTKLQGLTISSNTGQEVKGSVEAIGDQLKKIKNAESDLEPERKEKVAAATKSFETQLKAVASGFAASLASGTPEAALKAAAPQLKSALSSLANAYSQALSPVNCS